MLSRRVERCADNIDLALSQRVTFRCADEFVDLYEVAGINGGARRLWTETVN